MRKRGSNNKGFTLIELMVVIVIMAILFALVAYSVSRMLPNMQIATAGQQLLGAVGKARMLSVTKSCYVRLRLVSTGITNPTLDSIAILVQDPMDTTDWIHFYQVSTTTLSQGVKFNQGTVEYKFWRDGSVEQAPPTNPTIFCVNRTATTKALIVARATGIAEMNPGY